jgi:hypothetical protein
MLGVVHVIVALLPSGVIVGVFTPVTVSWGVPEVKGAV